MYVIVAGIFFIILAIYIHVKTGWPEFEAPRGPIGGP